MRRFTYNVRDIVLEIEKIVVEKKSCYVKLTLNFRIRFSINYFLLIERTINKCSQNVRINKFYFQNLYIKLRFFKSFNFF